MSDIDESIDALVNFGGERDLDQALRTLIRKGTLSAR